MIIGAYQFAVTGDINHNFEVIKKAVGIAAEKGVKLLVFPECALTGYPPVKILPSEINFNEVKRCIQKLRQLSEESKIYLLLGSAVEEDGHVFNSAMLFPPDMSEPREYRKRALSGWDADNFTEGISEGVFEIEGYRIGVRICFEIRFPEYFRELYRARTDINIVLFCDISDNDNVERYELIKAHLRTRAVENVCTTISVNDISPYQTAPSAVINFDGKILAEAPRNKESMLIYEFKNEEKTFGAKGRIAINEKITKDKGVY